MISFISVLQPVLKESMLSVSEEMQVYGVWFIGSLIVCSNDESSFCNRVQLRSPEPIVWLFGSSSYLSCDKVRYYSHEYIQAHNSSCRLLHGRRARSCGSTLLIGCCARRASDQWVRFRWWRPPSGRIRCSSFCCEK